MNKKIILFIFMLSLNFLTQSMDTNNEKGNQQTPLVRIHKGPIIGYSHVNMQKMTKNKKRKCSCPTDKKKTVPQAKRVKKTEPFNQDQLIFTDQELDELWGQKKASQTKPIAVHPKNTCQNNSIINAPFLTIQEKRNIEVENYIVSLSNQVKGKKFEKMILMNIEAAIDKKDFFTLKGYQKYLLNNQLNYKTTTLDMLYFRYWSHKKTCDYFVLNKIKEANKCRSIINLLIKKYSEKRLNNE